MDDVRQALEEYAGHAEEFEVRGIQTLDEFAPRAFDALRAVLDLSDECDEVGHYAEVQLMSIVRVAILSALTDDLTEVRDG